MVMLLFQAGEDDIQLVTIFFIKIPKMSQMLQE